MRGEGVSCYIFILEHLTFMFTIKTVREKHNRHKNSSRQMLEGIFFTVIDLTPTDLNFTSNSLISCHFLMFSSTQRVYC